MEAKIFNILDNRNQVLLDIISLISKESRWYTIHEISKELKVVERTVQRYVNTLFAVIDEYNKECDNNFILLFQKNKGVKLWVAEGSNDWILKHFIIEKDEAFHILQALLFDKIDSVPKYAEKRHITTNYVRVTLKKIETFLAFFDLSLSKNYHTVDGEETQIRLVSYAVAWLCFKGITWPNAFYQIDEKKLTEQIQTMEQKLNLKMSHIQRKQFTYMFAVVLLRIRKKKIVSSHTEWKPYFPANQYSTLLPILKEFLEEYHIHSEEELYFLALVLQTCPILYHSDYFKHEIIDIHRKNNTDIYQATTAFIDLFGTELSEIPYDQMEMLFLKAFSSHLFCRIFHNFDHHLHGSDFFSNIQEYYPNLQKRLSHFLDLLYEKTHHSLFLEKNYLLQNYALIFSAVKPLTYYEPTIKIVLQTDLPELAQNLLQQILLDTFKYEYNILFLTDYSFQLPDLIFTNIPNNPSTEPIFLFEYPLNQRDWIEIRQIIHKMAQKKELAHL